MLVELSPTDRTLLRRIGDKIQGRSDVEDEAVTETVDRPISQASYLENNVRWVEFASMWRRRLQSGHGIVAGYAELPPLTAFEAGLALGYEAAVRPYLQVENPRAVSA